MVGTTVRLANEMPFWASSLLECKFFGNCGDHKELRKSEKNMFCINCKMSVCKHCLSNSTTHSLHLGLQILKYVYQDVVRLQDIQKHIDSSKIQTYKINGDKAIHLNPRPQTQTKDKSSRSKGGGLCCEACGRHIQDSFNRFCSIACKFSVSFEENGFSNLKESDQEVNTIIERNGDTNEETVSPTSLKDEAKSCVSASESSKLLAKEGVTNSSLEPSTPLKKRRRRRKFYPHRSPFKHIQILEAEIIEYTKSGVSKKHSETSGV